MATPAGSITAPERRRSVTWEDPLDAAALALELSGLDFLRGIADGRISPRPIAVLLGMSIAEVEPGRVTFNLDVGEHLYNPIGSVHGGMFCTCSTRPWAARYTPPFPTARRTRPSN